MLQVSSSEFQVRREPRFTGALSTRNSYGRIIATARAWLLANPGASFTIQDIATAAELSRRAVYNHFPSPEALYRETLHELIAELGERTAIDLPRDLSPTAAIDAFARRAAALLSSASNLLVWRAIARCGVGEEWLAIAYHRQVREPLVRTVELCLLRQRIGSADPEQAARQLIGMLEAASVTPALLGARPGPAGDTEIGFVVASFLSAHTPAGHDAPMLKAAHA